MSSKKHPLGEKRNHPGSKLRQGFWMVFRLGVNNWGLNNYIYSSLNKTNKQIVSQLAINCFILSIGKEEFSNCSYLISKIKTLLDNELNFYEQTVFLYATGYFEFKRCQSTSGIEKMKQAIQVFDILGEDKLKLHYTDHFNKLVNKE